MESRVEQLDKFFIAEIEDLIRDGQKYEKEIAELKAAVKKLESKK